MTKPAVSFLQESESAKTDAESLKKKFLETLNQNLMDSASSGSAPILKSNTPFNQMRFSEARVSAQSGANPAPTDKDLNKSQVFQKTLREKLQKDRVWFASPDERQKSNFEAKNDMDPFVSYLGYLRDTSLKAFEVVEKKELIEYNRKSAAAGGAAAAAAGGAAAAGAATGAAAGGAVASKF